MRSLLENCLLLQFLFITSATDAERKFQIICVDESPYCKRRSNLCQSSAFHRVMRSHCRKTCNLCEDSGKEEILEDQLKKEPDLEIVDVEDDENTDNVEYSESETATDQVEEEEEITEEQAITLPAAIPHPTTKVWKQTACADSSTDCEGKQHLCSERTYAYLMRRKCPETCGLCPSDHRPSINMWKCRDMAPNCAESLCSRGSYQQLMQAFCKRTCSWCHLDDSENSKI